MKINLINFLRIFLFPILFLLSGFYYIIILILSKYINKNIKIFYTRTKVICIGNFTLGGTGKTEVVKKLVRDLKLNNKEVVIITRGYKRKSKENILFLSGEKNLNEIDSKTYGDEATMLFKELKVPVVVGKKKKDLISFAIENFNPEFIISDDGYQNYTFHKDFNILIINVNKNFWDNFFFPLGNLRESFKDSVKRADIVVLNHVDMVDSKEVYKIKRKIFGINKNIKLVTTFYTAKSIINFFNNDEVLVDVFREKNCKINIFSGIGFPESLEFVLKQNNFSIDKKYFFKDHYWYKPSDLTKIFSNELPVITTKKDIVRIEKILETMNEDTKKKINILNIELTILEGNDIWKEMLIYL